MKIQRAEQWGMCFGVRDAIATAMHERAAGPVTVLGELVHNKTVLAELTRRDVPMVRTLSEVTTPTVMISAHGTSDRVRTEIRARGLKVVEATCPLVRVAHVALASLVQEGYYPVVVGKKGHVEVQGLIGDYAEITVIQEEEDLVSLPLRERYGVIAQTTQTTERVRLLFEKIRARVSPAEVRLFDTVCQPTKLRQAAASKLARECSVVVVVGGAESNNTRELVATCQRECARVFHVQSAEELRAFWFQNTDVVGITAGTSTPDAVVDAVENWLRSFAEFQEHIEAHLGLLNHG